MFGTLSTASMPTVGDYFVGVSPINSTEQWNPNKLNSDIEPDRLYSTAGLLPVLYLGGTIGLSSLKDHLYLFSPSDFHIYTIDAAYWGFQYTSFPKYRELRFSPWHTTSLIGSFGTPALDVEEDKAVEEDVQSQQKISLREAVAIATAVADKIEQAITEKARTEAREREHLFKEENSD